MKCPNSTLWCLVGLVSAQAPFYKTPGELDFLEKFITSDAQRFREFLNSTDHDLNDFESFFDDLEKPETFSPTDDYYKRLMVRKCGIRTDKWIKLKEYYRKTSGESETKCYRQLRQFQKDLEDGNYQAQRMCDSWGEDLKFRNFPGLQSQLRMPYMNLRTTKPGFINQCNQAQRIGVLDSYRGQWLMSRPIFHHLKSHGIEFKECATRCTDDDTLSPEELSECITACIYKENDPLNVKLLDYYRGRGLCYPDACSAEEILILQSNVANVSAINVFQNEAKGGQWVTRHAFTSPLRMDIETYSNKIDRVNKGTISGYFIFCGIMILSVSVASLIKKRDPENSSWFVEIFAYQKPLDKLFSSKRPSKAIKCIDGIRSLSMMWVVLGHLYLYGMRMPDFRFMEQQMKNGEWSFIFNATLSVDSFFAIGALLLAYLSTDTIIKKFNGLSSFITSYCIYLVNRYMRLTPYILFVTWTIVAFPLMFVDSWTTSTSTFSAFICTDELWKSLFYVSSWMEPANQLCNAVQWYLSCDFFYYALFPFVRALFLQRYKNDMTHIISKKVAVVYGKKRSVAVLVVLMLAFVSIGYAIWSALDLEQNGYIAQTYRVYTSWPTDRKHDPYFTVWARYHSHGVGILFGWAVLNERKHKTVEKFLQTRTKVVKALLISTAWAVSLFLLWWTIFGINYCFKVNWIGAGNFYDPRTLQEERFSGCMTKNGDIDWIAVAIWDALVRPLWCIGLGILIMLCDMGHGFVVSWFLNGTVWTLIGKLSFGMYLWHLNVINILESTRKTAHLIDGYWLFWTFISIQVVVGIISAVCHILIESPFAIAWNLCLKKLTSNKPKEVETEKSTKMLSEERSNPAEKL